MHLPSRPFVASGEPTVLLEESSSRHMTSLPAWTYYERGNGHSMNILRTLANVCQGWVKWMQGTDGSWNISIILWLLSSMCSTITRAQSERDALLFQYVVCSS